MNINDLQSSLASVKLRKTGINPDAHKLSLQHIMFEQDLQAHQRTALDYNMEEWMDRIKDVTFETIYIPISIQQAQLFIDVFHQLYSIDPQAQGNELINPLEHAQAWDPSNDFLQKVTPEARVQVQYLIDAVDHELKKLEHAQVFVKTSSRSPKDAASTCLKVHQLYKSTLYEMCPNVDSLTKAEQENFRLRALLHAGGECLRVSSGTEAVALLCHSERIMQDMRMALCHPDRFKEHIMLRVWKPINTELEFRGFVTNGQLNALSQYNHLIHVPEIQSQQDLIIQRIQQFFLESVAAPLASVYEKYVVDFAFEKGPLEMARIYVVEINPFLPTTDACCFSWEKERDILEQLPFTFRCRQTPVLGGRALLRDDWRKILES